MGAEQENEDAEQLSVEKVSVRTAVATAVDHIRSVCFKRNITIETDLDGVNVEADSTLIVPAIASLLTNGINAMPAGGELSVTLVDTDSQWELEVADSGRSPSRFSASQAPDHISEHPPVFIEFLSHQALHEVGLLAEEYSGNMQTYPCPLGGSAHVLIIPKFAGQTNQVNSVAQNQSRRAA